MGALSAMGNAISGIGKAAGGVVSGAGKALGSGFHGMQQYYRNEALKRELAAIEQATPANTPARIEAVRKVAAKYGLQLPGGTQSYEPISTEAERAAVERYRAQGKYYESGAARRGDGGLGVSDLKDLGDTYAKVSGNLPTDPNDPAYGAGSKILKRLDMAISSLDQEESATGADVGSPTGQGTVEPAGPRPGRALSAIPPEEQWKDQYRPGWRGTSPAGQAPEPTQEPAPAEEPQAQGGGGWFKRMGGAIAKASTTPGVGAAHVMGAPLSPMEQARQVDRTLTQMENAGAVTTRNAGKVQQSQAAPADTLKTVARAVKAYKASPEYLQTSHDTGRLFNETDISGQMKEILTKESPAAQKRLLRLIHKHGEQKVLARLSGSSKPQGEF